MKFQLEFDKNIVRLVQLDEQDMSILANDNRLASFEHSLTSNKAIRLLVMHADAGLPALRFWLNKTQDKQFEINCVTDLDEAMPFLQSQSVDVLMLDLALLADNPLQTIEQLLGKVIETAIILIYDEHDEPLVHAAMQKGVQDGIQRSMLGNSNLQDIITRAFDRQISRYRLIHENYYLQAKASDQQKALHDFEKKFYRVSQIKQALEQKIEKQYTFCDTIHDIVGALIVVLDPEGRIIRFNHACREMTGYALHEVVGKKVWDLLLTPEETPAVKEVFSNLVTEKLPGKYENYWVTREGKKRRIAWANTVFVDEDGNIEYVISSGIDITDQNRVAQALRKSENELRLITDALPVRIAYIDNNFQVQFINRAYEEWSGLSRQQIQGKHIRFIISEQGYAKVRQYFEKVISGKEVNFELSMNDSSHSTQYMSYTFVPDFSDDGEVRGFFSVASDISQLKEAERQERKRVIELAHLSRLSTMGEMTAEIAHELNQPLTAIASYSDACLRMLQTGTNNLGEVPEVLHEICGQSQYAGGIIKRLRSFLQKRESHREALNINELIRHVLQLLQLDSRYHDVELELNLSDDVPIVWADNVMIEQVVLNLARNAIEAAQSGSGLLPAKVSITTHINNNQVEVIISDNGPGFDKEQYDHLFEAFYTTKEDGVGIGLNISRSIIHDHDGKIWADMANKLSGADFHFTLPITTESSNL